LARRRLRPSQAKKRSTTHRLGWDGEADLIALFLDDLDGMCVAVATRSPA